MTVTSSTGSARWWVAKYLPDRFKDGVKSERASASAAARRAAADKLTDPSKEKILTIQKCGNTDFVNVLLKKLFYTRLERIVEKLRTTPDVIISNALLLMLKRLEGKARERHARRARRNRHPSGLRSLQKTY